MAGGDGEMLLKGYRLYKMNKSGGLMYHMVISLTIVYMDLKVAQRIDPKYTYDNKKAFR